MRLNRILFRLILLTAVALFVATAFAATAKTAPKKVERWGIFELSLTGPSGGNPFVDVELIAEFKQKGQVFEPEGFYDGDGVYRIRFMPDTLGEWTYVTKSSRREIDGKKGKFTCVKVRQNDPALRLAGGNHGPVRVHKTWHFEYADGTPYFQVGTTCYAWIHQGIAMEEQTLATLKKAPFNKMRMCVFPKDYTYNKNEPKYYPFEGKPLKDWDYSRFNPEFFRHFERRVADLRDLGIEADIILFHPYDRWGFAKMDARTDDRYLRYIVARLSAYRNVWWSFANEFDLMKSKKMADWNRFFQIVQKYDPYNRMRGIHNCRKFYDHNKPWVTHASIQSSDLARGSQWRNKYKKPIVYDECKYEGNIPQGWGNITAQELVHRFWLGTIGGCYVGHGETYQHPKDLLWWSKGGVLRGQSPARIAFLKKIMEPTPFAEMLPAELSRGNYVLSKPGELYFIYFTGPTAITLELPGRKAYKVDGIDTWNMTVTSMGSASPGRFNFTPPKSKYVLRLSVYEPGEKMRPEVKASASPTEGIAPLKVQFSTPTKLHIGQWTFFAVTYDATVAQDNVRWYFGDADTPAQLGRTTTYNRGPTGKGSGTLTVGNYNETIQRHGKDRQFRGRLRGIQVFGSRIGLRGALSLSEIRKYQR